MLYIKSGTTVGCGCWFGGGVGGKGFFFHSMQQRPV